jgi:hypothetical protein
LKAAQALTATPVFPAACIHRARALVRSGHSITRCPSLHLLSLVVCWLIWVWVTAYHLSLESILR